MLSANNVTLQQERDLNFCDITLIQKYSTYGSNTVQLPGKLWEIYEVIFSKK